MNEVQTGKGGAGDLKAEQLAQALGAQWWNVKIPKGSQDQFLEVTFVDENGTLASSGGTPGWHREGEIVQFFVFGSTKDTIRFAIVGNGKSMRGEMKNKLQEVEGPKSRIITIPLTLPNPARPGDIFIKSGSGTVSHVPREIKKGEIGITLTLHDPAIDGEKEKPATVDAGKK